MAAPTFPLRVKHEPRSGFGVGEGGRAREERKERFLDSAGMTIVALVDDARGANVEGKVSACCVRNER